VNGVMNLFSKMWGVSCLAKDLLASQEGLCPMELFGWSVGKLVSFRRDSPNYGQTLRPDSPQFPDFVHENFNTCTC
jgi:hypothetical protein